MINMSKLYLHVDYTAALLEFKVNRKWSTFKNVQLEVSKYKCPICECSLKSGELLTRYAGKNNEKEIEIIATVDHYRPQKYYDFLKLEHTNYILMCSECNNMYKGSSFPLHPITSNRAGNINSLINENPLIVNPISDNLIDLFTLVFKYTKSSRKVLELMPKHKSGYLYEKALETIKLFSLGDCEDHAHVNSNVRNLRVNLLHNHFVKFEGLIEALNNKNIPKMINEIEQHNLKEYGIFEFIIKKQYVNLT